mmetsp:Transcript_5070/g.4633  ORF Transcript_5070/g.4633 Transcript_5070/m.4633 type:complete len:175 (-) Transcript_5070:192-716(-)
MLDEMNGLGEKGFDLVPTNGEYSKSKREESAKKDSGKKQIAYIYLRRKQDSKKRDQESRSNHSHKWYWSGKNMSEQASPEKDQVKPGMNSHLASVYQSVQPTKSYIHEWEKYQQKNQNTSDLVKKHQSNVHHWKQDRFLAENHSGVKNNQSKEGRKLGLAEFHRRFKEKPLRKS